MDRGAWQATVHGVTKELDMTEQLNNEKVASDTGRSPEETQDVPCAQNLR